MRYKIILLVLLNIGFSQSSVTIGGTGTAATSAHITVSTDGYKCPDSYIVESGASLTTWDPSAVCDASTIGDGDISLPVELAYFTAKNTMEGVLCQWRTESELENIGFLIDRRIKDGSWTEVVGYKDDDSLIGQGTKSAPTDYEFVDKLVQPNTTYDYRLADVDYNGKVAYHSIITVTVEKAALSSKLDRFTVLPAYPNPFNPNTTLTYGLENDAKVIVNIYDLTGNLVNTLINKYQVRGWHTIEWNGTDNNNNQVPAGIYFGKFSSYDQTMTIKLMILK